MRQNSKNGKKDRGRLSSSRDHALEDLFRLAPQISDKELTSLLAEYAEKGKPRAKSKRSRPALEIPSGD